MSGIRPVVPLVWALVAGTACAAGAGAGESSRRHAPEETARPEDERAAADALAERPWEILSNKGETLVSNVFYAEPTQNEQVMPWALDNRVAIERLIYPTLGNPNLYVRSDPEDQLVIVLRIEEDAIAHLAPKLTEVSGSPLREMKLADAATDALAFYLVGRSGRSGATESTSAVYERPDVLRIKPSKILVSPEPSDMPSVFRGRKTVRFVFDQSAMRDVPAGLYDARFEIRKNGLLWANLYEYQYNAVRVFDEEAAEYTALNVTDTQISVGAVYQTLTADKLDELVSYLATASDPRVRNAAFITFNGDLHNGGSPGTLRQRTVATTYNAEAKRIVAALKQLDVPIFLTPGNHDGSVALGHAPSAIVDADRLLGDSLEKVVTEQNNKAWPNFTWGDYEAFLDRTDLQREGIHQDLVAGAFRRTRGDTYATFREIPRAERNMVLYDGFHQWQKTYGPLYGSFRFGKNRYVSMNSYELRQHRRTGWGMYVVNYGGAVSAVQLDWLDRELKRAEKGGEDVVVSMHHDPRGGHEGKDLGYYFPLLAYQSIVQSTINYAMSEIFNPLICKDPDAVLNVEQQGACLHDGLHEWMAPDDEYDREGGGVFFSGVELLERISASPAVRTLLLGHTHFNSLEVLQTGAPLVPGKLSLGDGGRGGHELAVIRSTSAADLTSQTYGARSMHGYSVLHVTNATASPRINQLTFFLNAGGGAFEEVATVDVPRNASLASRGVDNPVDSLFDW